MKQRLVLMTLVAGFLAMALGSCARMDQRAPRYDTKQCPFCVHKAGECSYCNGTAKCTFCKGTGQRTTVTPAISEGDIKPSSYQEKCPYCKSTGVCRYCDGKGKCWACKGTGRIESWDFYEQQKQQQK